MAVIDERHGLRLRHSRLVQGPTLQRWLSAIAFQKAEKRERARELSSSPAVWQPSSLFFFSSMQRQPGGVVAYPLRSGSLVAVFFFFRPPASGRPQLVYIGQEIG
jgi:hypothetical protein